MYANAQGGPGESICLLLVLRAWDISFSSCIILYLMTTCKIHVLVLSRIKYYYLSIVRGVSSVGISDTAPSSTNTWYNALTDAVSNICMWLLIQNPQWSYYSYEESNTVKPFMFMTINLFAFFGRANFHCPLYFAFPRCWRRWTQRKILFLFHRKQNAYNKIVFPLHMKKKSP